MSDVGFIGLGSMGFGMARRLVDAGHNVRVWNRSPASADSLVAAGATLAGSAAEALRSGIAFSMLANDAAADEVFSESTLAEAPGTAHVNMATVSLATARTLQERHENAGVAYAAAPVMGRPNLAASGQLNIVTAGSADALARANPFWTALGRRVWNVGSDATQANLVKIGVNYNLIHTIQALAESLTLMERGGVSGDAFVEILTDTAYTGTAYTVYGDIIANQRYSPPGFSVALGLKDLSLVEAAASESAISLPTIAALRNVFETALGDPELSILDWSATAEITRRS